MAIDPFFKWQNESDISQKKYTCGHPSCGREVASNTGWYYANPRSGVTEGWIYICPMCHRPTFFDDTVSPTLQVPGAGFGKGIEHLPKDIEDLYEEIRKTTSDEAFTSAVLACRKILMHIAVEKGAPEGKNFITYVEYLVDNHYAPPGSRSWVDKIRESGNEANHEIKIMTADEAKELVTFVEMLLKFIYEFPAKIGTPTNT